MCGAYIGSPVGICASKPFCVDASYDVSFDSLLVQPFNRSPFYVISRCALAYPRHCRCYIKSSGRTDQSCTPLLIIDRFFYERIFKYIYIIGYFILKVKQKVGITIPPKHRGGLVLVIPKLPTVSILAFEFLINN